MEIKSLNENRIVFFNSVMKELIPEDEKRILGSVNYSDGYSNESLNFEANVIYENSGKLMLANDYFKDLKISKFYPEDGCSAGRMIDNWSPRDQVKYSEREAPEDLIKKLEALDIKTSGYSKKEWEDKIQAITNRISEVDGDITELAKELGCVLAKYFRLCHFNDLEEKTPEFEYNIKLAGEDEAPLRSLYILNGGDLIDGIKIKSEEGKDPEIIFFNSGNENIGIEEMSPEGIVELVDLLIDQSFYGTTSI